MTTVTAALRILLIEDDEDDYLITRDMLEGQSTTRFRLDWCTNYNDALQVITEQAHDAYLIDYRLGQHTGLDVIRDGFATRPRAPVIMLTGEDDPEVDLEAADLGVTDYLLKRELNPYSLERSVRYAIRQHRVLQDLEASEQRYALAARAVNDGIWDWDLQTGQIYFSPRWSALVGREEVAREGRPEDWFDLVHPDDRAGLELAIEAHLSGRTSLLHSKHRMHHADGGWRWVLVRGVAVSDVAGQPTRMAGSMSDITASRRTEHQLEHDAFHDSLTGLANRSLFMDRVERAILRRARLPESRCAVLFIDMDRFKLVNDTFSHGTGDQLLVALARRLLAELRPSDTVCRIGGDEFTVLLDDLTADEATAYAMSVAGRIQASLEREFVVDGHPVYITASTGVAIWEAGMTAADLLRNADIAMYEAKHQGRNRCAVFNQNMHRRIAERMAMENDLRQVVETGIIDVHYQPVVDLRSGALAGFEALARWPAGWGPVSPDEFIPVAEETGLITVLGRQVLTRALEQMAEWRKTSAVADDVAISVNVSARQLDDPYFPDLVATCLARAGIPGNRLRLEITERTLMQDTDRMIEVLNRLTAAGVALELDDFGTGYSSLAALHRFPVSALKIDRSFVSNLLTDGGSDAIVRSTIALCDSLGHAAVAEGIEDVEQVRRLRELGCRYGQGFLLAKPRPADEVEKLLGRWGSGWTCGG